MKTKHNPPEQYPRQRAIRASVVRSIYSKVHALMLSEADRLMRLRIARDLERIASYMDKEGLSYV